MASWWWSWLLAAVGVTGLWLAGSKRAVGWAIGIAVQGLWIAYAVATAQWGFIAAAIAYGTVHTRNYLRWLRDQTEPEDLTVPEGPPTPVKITDPKD